jgi:mono/diheme cytochrome c family protein
MKKIITTIMLLVILKVCLSTENYPNPINKSSILRGKKIYKTYCLSCHQIDGSGVPDMNPPLQRSYIVSGKSNRVIKIVLNGLNDGVEINGNTYSNPMPAFGNTLKNQEIADVLTYVRQNFGNKAGAITAIQVKKARLQPN